MDKMLRLIMVRGLPGSGKTTLAKLLAELFDGVEMSADDYFYRDGEYDFDAKLLHFAHQDCQIRCKNAMYAKWPTVIIHNTSTTDKEMKPYLEMAEEYGYQVTSIITENRHGKQSVHGVPAETLEKMRNRFSVKL